MYDTFQYDVFLCRNTKNKVVERSLAERMLDLHKSLAAAKTPHQQTALQRQIAATDQQIDALVYDLYALTPDEIALVEQATQKKD